MRRLTWVVVAWAGLSAGCFEESGIPSPGAAPDDGGGTEGTATVTSGASSTSSTTTGSETESTTSPTTTGMTSTSATTDDSTGPGPGCMGVDCPCDDGGGCPMGLVCVDDRCTPCGNGVVEGPEQCDGAVDNGSCLACMLTCDDGFANCDDDPDNGCEVNLTSMVNCGTCGRDCLGGQCMDGECQPVNLATGQNQPLGLDVEGNFIAWTNYGFDLGQGEVWIRALDNNSPPVPLASGLTFPGSVVLDGTNVYYSDTDGTGDVARVDYDGSGQISDWLSAANASFTTHLLVDSLHVYAIRRQDPPVRAGKGAFQTPVAMTETATARAGFLHEGYLYYSQPGVDGGIMRIEVDPMGDFPATPEVVVAGEPNAYGVYVHNDRVYWTQAINMGVGNVRGQDLDGNNFIEYAVGLENSEDLVVDDNHLYFVERSLDGQLWRATVDGMELESLDDVFCGGIDHDEQAIYWTDQIGGVIRMLAK